MEKQGITRTVFFSNSKNISSLQLELFTNFSLQITAVNVASLSLSILFPGLWASASGSWFKSWQVDWLTVVTKRLCLLRARTHKHTHTHDHTLACKLTLLAPRYKVIWQARKHTTGWLDERCLWKLLASDLECFEPTGTIIWLTEQPRAGFGCAVAWPQAWSYHRTDQAIRAWVRQGCWNLWKQKGKPTNWSWPVRRNWL